LEIASTLYFKGEHDKLTWKLKQTMSSFKGLFLMAVCLVVIYI